MSNSAAMGPGEDNAVDEEMSEEVVPRDWTPQEKALHEAKLKAKAKYRIRRTSSRDSESNETHSEAPVPPGRSHDRKSRMGKGRGLPKKGGAGGKGVWGAPGQVYSYQEPDMQDPNYDESAQGDTVYQKVVPELDELGLQRNVQPTVQEFFEHGDTGEVIVSIFVYGSARVPCVRGSAWVPCVRSSARVPCVHGSAWVPCMRSSAWVPCVHGTARVPCVRGSARVPCVRGSARVPSVRGSARVPCVRGSARVPCVRGSARVPCVRGSARVHCVRGSARVHCVRGSARVPCVRRSARVPCVRRSARVPCVHHSARVPCVRRSARVPCVRRSARVPCVRRSARVLCMRAALPDLCMHGSAQDPACAALPWLSKCAAPNLILFIQALLKELNLGRQTPGVPRLAMSLALEGKASHRELTSRLLSDLVGKVLSEEDNAEAFDRMLSDLPDLILDTPEAPQMLGQFIARAVADHALPLDFLDRYKGRVDCDHARAALDRAAVLLRIKREIIRLDNVWGVGGGQRPVKHLIKEVTWMDFLLCVGARRSLHAALSARGALCTRSLWTLDFVGMIPMAHSVLLSACSDLRLSGSPSLYCRTLTIICSLVLLQEHRILHLNCFTITDPLKMAAVTSDLCHPGAEPLVKVIAHV
uniref:MI domain-containing protein n=1 Tax=Leptobrachium leishanense TaxID=445787 RepID=A0A8C5Q0K9_9ANUR